VDRQQEFVLRTLEERDIRFVRLWFTDVLGTLKSVSVAPAPPENVIQYSHGRYELRGDGVSTPYRWVWIPNPPPPPPAAPPPPTGEPPSFVPSPGDSSPGGPAAPRQSQLYRWTDTVGVVHWTDRIDSVPEKYRAGARQYPPS